MVSKKLETFSTICIMLVCSSVFVTCKDCTTNNECSCTFSDGSGNVDLTSLGNTDGSPRFKDILFSDEGYYYSYNPCGGFTEGDCSKAASCVSNEDKSEQQQIGDAKRATFKWDDENENVIAAYTSGTGVLRLTTVNLICDKTACTPKFEPQGEQGAGQFEMTLTTICACPGMCDSSGPRSCSGGGSGSGGGLSGGSILLIAFFSILIIYFVAGAVFMKVRNQATGTDLIPNKSLWTNIPGLIGAGFKFVYSKITRKSMSYEQI